MLILSTDTSIQSQIECMMLVLVQNDLLVSELVEYHIPSGYKLYWIAYIYNTILK